MVQASADGIYGRTNRNSRTLMPGDIDAINFDFNMRLTKEQRLTLFERNEVIQLACEWAVNEAIRQGVTHDVDQTIVGEKHGRPYVFKPSTIVDQETGKTKIKQGYNKYLEWLGFWIKLQEGLQWSKLFGSSIAVFWDAQNGVANKQWGDRKVLSQGLFFGANKNPQAYLDFSCYYPYTFGSGYEILEADDDGNPTLYKIKMKTTGMKRTKTVYVDAKRVVPLHNTRKRLTHEGSSRIKGLELYALAGDQMFRALLDRAKKSAGGILKVMGVESDAEEERLNTIIGDDVTQTDRVYLGVGKDLSWETPDMKASGEFKSIFDMLTRTEARHLRFSQKLMDGESQGAISSAKFDMLSSYTEIYGIQAHYKRNIEEMFFKLGKTDTSFEYNDIVPEMMDSGNDYNDGFGKNKSDKKDNNTNITKKED